MWDTSNGECEVTLDHGEEFAVLSCDFSADASSLITGDTSGSVKVQYVQYVCVCVCVCMWWLCGVVVVSWAQGPRS